MFFSVLLIIETLGGIDMSAVFGNDVGLGNIRCNCLLGIASVGLTTRV